MNRESAALRPHEVEQAMRRMKALVKAAQASPESLQKMLGRMFPGTKRPSPR
jgi:hypothetical protein